MSGDLGRLAELEELFRGYLKSRDGGAADRESTVAAAPPELRADFEQMLRDYEHLAGTAQAAAPSLESGRELGPFRLVRELGRGGMGVVWEAEQAGGADRVALKLLFSQHSHSPRVLQRFQREAQAGMRLAHPGVVRVHGFGATCGWHYLCQELVPGGRTLADLIEDARSRPELDQDHYRTVARIFLEVTAAMDYAHAQGVIHRDLKPGNVLLDGDGRPRIADFGLALVRGELELSKTGEFLGTYSYMSPEQALGKRMTLDHRSDVFSLGATLYEALTLQRAFDGDTVHQIVEKIALVDPPDPRLVRSKTPAPLALICLKALEKHPARRYPSMGELGIDLRRYLDGAAIRARPAGRLRKLGRWLRRDPSRALAAGVLVISLPTIGFLGSQVWRDARLRRAAGRTEQAEALLREGIYLEMEEDFDRAQRCFERSMAAKPSAEALTSLLFSYVLQGRGEDCRALLKTHAGLVRAHPEIQRLITQERPESMGRELGTPLAYLLEAKFLIAGAGSAALTPGEGLELARQALWKALLGAERPQAQNAMFLAEVIGQLEDSKHREDAEQISTYLLRHWPDSAVARAAAALAWQGVGEIEVAVDLLEQAVVLDAGLARAWSDLGILRKRLDDREGAMQAFQSALAADPQCAEAHNGVGNWLFDESEFEQAEAAFRAALAARPRFPQAKRNLAVALYERGDLDGALAACREALIDDPEYASAHELLGSLLSKQGEHQAALAAHRRAVELRPDLTSSRFHLALALLEAGQPAEARDQLEIILKAEPEHEQARSQLAILDESSPGEERQ